MAKKKVRLLQDPRYKGFVERYAMDLARFSVEVCGVTPTWQQLDFFESLQRPGSRTSVSSGHGTGKTQAFAIAVLWHLICYAYSNTILSAPKLDTVLSGVRKYAADIHDLIRKGKQAWVADHIVIAFKSIYIRGFKSQWWVAAKTAPAGKPEAMAGEHRKFMLWLIDEASGVSDGVMGVVMGSLTEEWNRIALASQPTRAGGLFYDSHHRLSESRGGPWRSITMSSEESPLVSDAFILEKLMQYGGRDDPQYQIKVLGRFPEKLEGQLLSRAQLEACIGRRNVIPPGADWGYVVLVDVAAGEYRDKSVVVVAKVTGSGLYHEQNPRRMHIVSMPVCSSSIQPTDLVGEIIRVAGELENPTVLIDCGGMGLAIFKRLEEIGQANCVKVLWGNPCFRRALQEQFFNQRAQGMVAAAKAAQRSLLSIDPHAFLSTMVRNEFLDQCRVPYKYNDRAQYVILPKGAKEWEGLPSPDMLDAVSFGFLESATYIPSSASGDKAPRAGVDAAVERMRARREAMRAQAEAAASPIA